jgi:hypothetical protein
MLPIRNSLRELPRTAQVLPRSAEPVAASSLLVCAITRTTLLQRHGSAYASATTEKLSGFCGGSTCPQVDGIGSAPIALGTTRSTLALRHSRARRSLARRRGILQMVSPESSPTTFPRAIPQPRDRSNQPTTRHGWPWEWSAPDNNQTNQQLESS